jgi:vacuolar-type H+-ATPase subunit H
LARLLSTEARLEQLLRRAHDEAEALVTAARDAAQAREAALTAEVETLGRKLAATIGEERQRQERELAESGNAQVRRFDEVSAGEIEVLARYVVERVIGAEP